MYYFWVTRAEQSRHTLIDTTRQKPEGVETDIPIHIACIINGTALIRSPLENWPEHIYAVFLSLILHLRLHTIQQQCSNVSDAHEIDIYLYTEMGFHAVATTYVWWV